MRFDAYHKEALHQHIQSIALDRVGQRNYVLRRVPYTNGIPAFQELSLRVNIYPIDNGNEPSIKPYSFSMRLELTFCSYDVRLGELTPLELRQVAQIRENIDRWIAGDLDELPIEMPWEAQLWKP